MTKLPADGVLEQNPLQDLFDRQRAAFVKAGAPSAAQRRAVLQGLQQALLDNTDKLADAVSADFGNRSRHETKLLELFTSIAAIKHDRKHLRRWMKPQRRPVSIWFQPARAKVLYQPLGVAGIIVPWNYPLFLALAPLSSALAAGNRVMVKTAQASANTGLALKEIVGQVVSEEQVAIVHQAGMAEAFSALPFDHLLFTGSPEVGKTIMRAASDHLTPVTLELGGKSPAIIGPDADWDRAVERIMMGKMFNAGQTCIAPDYVLLPKDQEQRFADQARQAVTRHYPTLAENPDYTGIVNERQYQRLGAIVADAETKGARLIPLDPAGEILPPASRKMAPTLVLGTTPDMRIRQEEIFGPLLPLISYDTLDAAIAYVNERDRPLALYYFGRAKTDIDKVLSRTTSGGATINDTMLHAGQDELPFGGVGNSGMGQYHGRDGFETFSKKKGVMYQSRFSAVSLLYPPYGKLTDFLLKLMLRR